MNQPDKSPLQESLEKRKRTTYVVKATAFLGDRDPSINGEIKMRVLNVAEHSAAVLEATRMAKEVAKDTGLENDPDFMTNYKTACALQRACLQTERDVGVFRSAADMMRLMTADELSLLLGHYTNCLRLHGPGDSLLDAEKAEGLAAFLAQADPEQSISHLLASFTPSYLALLSVLVSVKLNALIEENKSLREHLQAKGVEITNAT